MVKVYDMYQRSAFNCGFVPAVFVAIKKGVIVAVGMFVMMAVPTVTPLIVNPTLVPAALTEIPRLTKLVLAAVAVLTVVVVLELVQFNVQLPPLTLFVY